MTTTSENLKPGRKVHLLRGTQYKGEYDLAKVEHHEGDWYRIETTDRIQWFTREADAFDTEEEARAEARRRRRPRQPRQARPLYGDYAQLAAMNGIATDGTGRITR